MRAERRSTSREYLKNKAENHRARAQQHMAFGDSSRAKRHLERARRLEFGGHDYEKLLSVLKGHEWHDLRVIENKEYFEGSILLHDELFNEIIKRFQDPQLLSLFTDISLLKFIELFLTDNQVTFCIKSLKGKYSQTDRVAFRQIVVETALNNLKDIMQECLEYSHNISDICEYLNAYFKTQSGYINHSAVSAMIKEYITMKPNQPAIYGETRTPHSETNINGILKSWEEQTQVSSVFQEKERMSAFRTTVETLRVHVIAQIPEVREFYEDLKTDIEKKKVCT